MISPVSRSRFPQILCKRENIHNTIDEKEAHRQRKIASKVKLIKDRNQVQMLHNHLAVWPEAGRRRNNSLRRHPSQVSCKNSNWASTLLYSPASMIRRKRWREKNSSAVTWSNFIMYRPRKAKSKSISTPSPSSSGQVSTMTRQRWSRERREARPCRITLSKSQCWCFKWHEGLSCAARRILPPCSSSPVTSLRRSFSSQYSSLSYRTRASWRRRKRKRSTSSYLRQCSRLALRSRRRPMRRRSRSLRPSFVTMKGPFWDCRMWLRYSRA